MKKIILLAVLLSAIIIDVSSQNALAFDGVNDYVQTNAYGPTGNNDRTFEAWIFNESTSTVCILDYGLNVSGGRNTLLVNSAGAITFISGGTNANLSTPAGIIIPNKWTHVAFVFDGGVATIYINGSSQATAPLSSVSTPANGTNIRIGQRVPGGSIPFNGKIEEVRIWNVARTAAEIQMYKDAELCSVNADLDLYFTFNSGIANLSNIGLTTAIDNSGNGNNSTLTNFTLSGNQSNWTTGVNLTSGFTSVVDHQFACNFLTWINGITYVSNNNSATFATSNASGCDTVFTLDLTIVNNLNATISQNVATLTANQTGVDYQWIDCQNNTALPGEINQSFIATTNGQYAVVIALGNSTCIDTSACVQINSFNACQNSLYLQNAINSNTYEAILDVTADGTIAAGENVIMNAGNYVELLPSFDCDENAELYLYILPCQ